MNFEGLNLSVFLFSIAAPLGAIDVLYFHIYKFRLATRPESRRETVTHIVRSLLFGVGLWIITTRQPQGVWFWAVLALFAFDFVNSVTDAFLERDSRAALGGLPRLEYVLHIVGATLMGVITLSFFLRGLPYASLPSGLPARCTGSTLMTVNALITVGISFLLAGYEAVTLWVRPRRLGLACCS